MKNHGILIVALAILPALAYAQQSPDVLPKGFEKAQVCRLSIFGRATIDGFDYDAFRFEEIGKNQMFIIDASMLQTQKSKDGSYDAFLATSDWIKDHGFQNNIVLINSKGRVKEANKSMWFNTVRVALQFKGLGKMLENGVEVSIPLFACLGYSTNDGLWLAGSDDVWTMF